MAYANHICQIETGDVGKIKYRGGTMFDAMNNTTNRCLELRINLYMKLRGHEPDKERKILFAEDCLNNNICWETE